MFKRKLRKSKKHRKLCGVCAGIAEFLNIDVTIIRLLVVAATIFTTQVGLAILAYLAVAFIVPNEGEDEEKMVDD